jgi:hypothetical protein
MMHTMETVFEATMALEAHLIRDLLERAGIPAHVEGEYLQGAAGELPLGNLVRVRVAAAKAAEAREIIADWEKAQPPPEPSSPIAGSKRSSSWAPYTFVLGGGLGFLLGWIHYNTPVSREGIDYDNDGKYEERYFWAGQKSTETEYDRNADGHIDGRYTYDSHGLVAESAFDQDFDRRFETRERFERGQPASFESDRDGDGFAEVVGRYVNGVQSEVQYFSPVTRRAVKKQYYRGGSLVADDFDADGDGTLERHTEYDELGEPKR